MWQRDQRHAIVAPADTVVLDLKLSAGSGLPVLEHIKAVYPLMTVIVLTNHGQAEYQSKCLALGADYFFDKSRDFDAFVLCLQARCQQTSDSAVAAVPGAAP